MKKAVKDGLLGRWMCWLPECLVLLAVLLVSCFMISQKEGYHEDELLSFEMANAYYTPWVTPTQPEGRLAKFMRNEIQADTLSEEWNNLVYVVRDLFENKSQSILATYKADVYEEPEWISREEFQNFLTVGEEGAFSYTSAYWNIKDDNHPPVHALLLHTVSSIFRGKINPWMGCGINLVFLLGTVGLLFALGRRFGVLLCWQQEGVMTRGRLLGLLCGLVYGISWGGISSVLLIRMYMVMTFFLVAYLYLCLGVWMGKFSKMLIPVTIFGFLTQYFFLFYCFLLAFVLVIALAASGRRKDAGGFFRRMFIAAVVGLILFPFAIDDVFRSGRGVQAIENLQNGLNGYGDNLLAFWKILAERTFGGTFALLFFIVAMVAMGTLLLMEAGQKDSVIPKAPDQNPVRDAACLLCILFIPAVGYFFLVARMAPYQVDRYMMGLFPVSIFLGVAALFAVAEILSRRAAEGTRPELHLRESSERGLISFITVLMVVLSCVRASRYDGEYWYKGYELEQKVLSMAATTYEDLPCICIYVGDFYENLLDFTYFDRTLILKTEELSEREETASLEGLDYVCVIMKEYVDQETVDGILYGYGLNWQQTLIVNGVHGDTVYIYGRN